MVKALGIEPDGIIGHSVGENACAYADGCLSVEEAMLASWSRAEIFVKYRTTDGLMAVVGTFLMIRGSGRLIHELKILPSVRRKRELRNTSHSARRYLRRLSQLEG